MKLTKALVVVVAILGLLALTTGCSQESASAVPAPKDLPEETRQASVFFASGRTLIEEPRVVDASDPYRHVLEELLEADPELNKDIAIVQPEAEIKDVTFEDGLVTVDWAPEVLDFEAEDSEKVLAFGAFLRTLGEFPEVEKVKFTVDGKTEGTVNDKDITAFWGRVSLNGQPWDALKPEPEEEEAEAEGAAPGEEEAPATEEEPPATDETKKD